MLKQCQDSYSVQFTQFPALLAYHEETRKASLWERSEVKSLRVAALDAKSPLYEDKSDFDPSVSQEAIADTAENLGLLITSSRLYQVHKRIHQQYQRAQVPSHTVCEATPSRYSVSP